MSSNLNEYNNDTNKVVNDSDINNSDINNSDSNKVTHVHPFHGKDPMTIILNMKDFNRRIPVIDGPQTHPSFLMPTNFVCNDKLQTIIDKVQSSLDNIPEISYEYFSDEYKWEVAYCFESEYCRFAITLYSNYNNQFIIEGKRASDNTSTFYSFFNQLEQYICKDGNAPIHIGNLSYREPIPESICGKLSDEDIDASFNPIFQLAKDEHEYSHLIAAQVLCDISLQVNMHAIMSTNGCIDILANMVNNTNEDISRLAAIALKNVSVTPSCQMEIILVDNLLPSLLARVSDGSYLTKATRLACINVLVNICKNSNLSKKFIIERINQEVITQWILTISKITDINIREEAMYISRELR